MRHREYRDHERPALYRSRNGCIFGVCRGISKSYGVSLFWIQALFVVGATMTGLWPAVGLYIIAALLMKMEPILPLETDEDEEFYHSYTASRSMALSRLKRTFDHLDRRIQRLETTVTTREYDWDRRLNS